LSILITLGLSIFFKGKTLKKRLPILF